MTHPDEDNVELDVEAILREFNESGWQAKAPHEDEWNTVELPAEPLVKVEGEEPVKESAWDGMMPEPQITIFDETFDQDLLDSYLCRVPEYEQLIGRYNPFDEEHLRPMLENAHYSTFLKRTTITFKDALDHAIQLAMFWQQEDIDCAALAEQQSERVKVERTKKYAETNAAKMEWKAAVAQRNEAMEKWNAYVDSMRLRYHALRREGR